MRKPLVGTILALAVAGTAMTVALAHKNSVGSNVTLNFRFQALTGAVRSPAQSCTMDRKVRVFKDVAGPDQLLRTTFTNRRGQWTVFVAYGEGVYYAKTSARTTTSPDHEHQCKADTSRYVSPPTRVTTDNAVARGWEVAGRYCYGESTAESYFVGGPKVAPLGAGSVRMVANEDEAYVETGNYEGVPLNDVKLIRFSAYVEPGSNDMALLYLSVDLDGDLETAGSNTISFLPNDQTQQWVTGKWQTWTATNGLWRAGNSYSVLRTWPQMQAHYPGAVLVDTAYYGSFGFRVPCSQVNKTDLDALTIRIGSQSETIDFDP